MKQIFMKRKAAFSTICLGLVCMLTACALSACNADGFDEAGDLYGRWKLTSVKAPTPVSHADTLYLAFQGEVYQYQPNWDYDWGTYIHTEDSLILNPLQYEKYNFKELGITVGSNRAKAAFQIDLLDRKNMQLIRHDTIWYFKKYIE